MKKISAIIISLLLTLTLTTPLSAGATGSKEVSPEISINGEYLIKDNDGIHSRYVVLATNESSADLSVKADFYAVSSDKDTIKAVHDSIDAVKAGQSFILYGQFIDDAIEGVSTFTYDIDAKVTNACRYDAVNVDVKESGNGTIAATGTNYSKSDVDAINVRALFYKNGTPVAFDSVNIADQGYVLHSGEENVQELGQSFDGYDRYEVTYSVSARNASPDSL